MAEKGKKKSKDRIPEDARQHARAAREEIRQGMEALMPEGYRDFHEHRKAARKEMLLAFRSLIDHAIQRTDEEDKE